MASMLKKIFAPLALAAVAVGMAGCGELPQDIAEKPEVVQQMVQNAESVCQTGPVNSSNAAYAERLTKVLSDATTANLKTLQGHNITVCLDQRLDAQKNGFWDGTVEGVFYPGTNGGGIATYHDNGMQPAQEDFWHSNPANYHGSEAVDALANKVNDGQLPKPGDYLTANIHGAKVRYADWDNATANEGSLKTNPQLQQAPVKAPVAAPVVKPAS